MKTRIFGQLDILQGANVQLHQRTIQRFMMKQSSMPKQ